MPASVRALVVSFSCASILCFASHAAAQLATFQQEIVGSVTNATFGTSVDVDGTLTVVGEVAPGAPTLSAPVVAGSTVSLSWAPGGGGTATGYLLIASATSGGPVLASVPLTGTSVVVPGVPSGTYHLRLIASNGAGASAPSNEVVAVVPDGPVGRRRSYRLIGP